MESDVLPLKTTKPLYKQWLRLVGGGGGSRTQGLLVLSYYNKRLFLDGKKMANYKEVTTS